MGFTHVKDEDIDALRRLGVSAQACWVWVVIGSSTFGRRGGRRLGAWQVGMEAIAERAGMSRRQVQRLVTELIGAGAVQRAAMYYQRPGERGSRQAHNEFEACRPWTTPGWTPASSNPVTRVRAGADARVHPPVDARVRAQEHVREGKHKQRNIPLPQELPSAVGTRRPAQRLSSWCAKWLVTEGLRHIPRPAVPEAEARAAWNSLSQLARRRFASTILPEGSLLEGVVAGHPVGVVGVDDFHHACEDVVAAYAHLIAPVDREGSLRVMTRVVPTTVLDAAVRDARAAGFSDVRDLRALLGSAADEALAQST